MSNRARALPADKSGRTDKATLHLFAKSFKFAKSECCNYQGSGPGRIADYCWSEPSDSESRCRMLYGIKCQWFADAVLPLNPNLAKEWNRFLVLAGEGGNLEVGDLRRCRCGNHFKPRSNRQERCPDCSEKHSRQMTRQRKARQRANSVTV